MNNKVKKIIIICTMLIMVSALLINNAPVSAFSENASSKENVEQLYNWLINTQLSNGALPVYGKEDGDVSINPYFSSITTLAILKYSGDESGLESVKNYYDWHFDRLNEDGSIYDYEAIIANKEIVSENSKADYDSADSYAALFLISLWKYIEAGGNKDYIIENQDKIYLIIDLMTSLIDDDGLSKVSHTNGTKYLMDNCEVYAGLNSASMILEKVVLGQYGVFSRDYWETVKQIVNLRLAGYKMKAAIEIHLWNNNSGCYDVGINSNGSTIVADECDDFYPDAVAQLFPIVFELIKADGQRAQTIYNKFSNEFQWERLSHYYDDKTNFYWGISSFCGSIMGDTEKVDEYIQNLHEAEAPDYRYPLYNADAAWVILAWEYLN